MQLEFTATGQYMERTDANKVVANSREYLKAHFTLPSDYTGVLTAHFQHTKDGAITEKPITITDGMCIVPSDVIKYPRFRVSITSDSSMFIPTNNVIVEVLPSGITDTLPPLPDGTPTQYEEFATMHSEVITSALNASTSEINSNVSEENAKVSETNAKLSETASLEHATTASEQAIIAMNLAAEAYASSESANLSEANAKASAESLAQSITTLELKADKVQEAWIIPTLTNEWVVYNGETVSYFKDSLGIVHLNGTLAGGTLTTVAFTLPTGYRPLVGKRVSVACASMPAMVLIGADGTITPVSGGNVWFSLDGITFKAEH